MRSRIASILILLLAVMAVGAKAADEPAAVKPDETAVTAKPDEPRAAVKPDELATIVKPGPKNEAFRRLQAANERSAG